MIRFNAGLRYSCGLRVGSLWKGRSALAPAPSALGTCGVVECCLEYNMAVVFGVPLLAPLGRMLNGQNVGGGGGGTAASSECVRAKELPQILSEMGWWKGAGLPATLGRKNQERQLRADQAETAADVDASMWLCISQEPPGASEAVHRADSGEPRKVAKSFRQQILQGKR